ncbi:MAG: hypothetical protein WCY62_11110 [Clostridia bacterium]
MKIENNIIKYYMKNTYFITGTAYAGKSTMVRMLAEKHDMIFCGENYHDAVASAVRNTENQPALCYFDTMSGWKEFLNRTPEEYYTWIKKASEEAAEFEIAELIRLSAKEKKIIVDTNISHDILREISDYNHVAVMLSIQSMSVDKFFDRDDPEKQFLLRQISLTDDPKRTMLNFKACIAKINCKEEYDRFADSGFFTLVRENNDKDTKMQMLESLEAHFKL